MLSNPFFSLNDIAYAYCEVDRNPYLAGLIQCEIQGIPPLVSTDQSNNKVKNDETSGSIYVKSSKKYSEACDVFTADQPVSTTTDECSGNGKKISKTKGETGFRRHYFEHARKGAYEICHLANGSYSGTKPIKVDSMEKLKSLFGVKNSNPVVRTRIMLGEEFRLKRDAIQEVDVDTTCKSYGTMNNVLILEDLKFIFLSYLLTYKSMEKLIDWSIAVKEYRATMKEYYKAISLEFSKCQSFVFNFVSNAYLAVGALFFNLNLKIRVSIGIRCLVSFLFFDHVCRRTLLVLSFALTLYYRFLDCIFQEH
ncbi:hypothetical protein CXB51_021791 [Gossypium anomalum]|uniref:Uncharacterized protein n=1 Tax=Gossypium anomalum TaxID=47600 RepID=A0A8J5Y8H9_9ROSI|nr:hypothetical protein CXB51_021791 [Gossypium anomalum]